MAAHDVASWDQLAELKIGLARSGSEIATFEAAADAIVNGRLATLRHLLAAAPDLVLRRSIRRHHSTLLHYVGANGIEYYRQKTPKNIVQVTELLLDAGADVNSHADMYGGGCTTLGLVATSVHPARAGRQNAIMELLVNCGASIGDAGSVNSCLANGRAAAAEWLAAHGAPLDLEGAAGVGRLDLVRACFQPNGGLKPGISSEQMSRAFAWACEYGRIAVAELLLEMGIDIAAPLRNHGQTGLHWAAHNAHPDLIRLLLKAGIPIEARDATFSATPLSWALHGWSDPPPGTPKAAYYEAVKALLAAGAEVEPAWLKRADVERDATMLGLLSSALTSRT